MGTTLEHSVHRDAYSLHKNKARDNDVWPVLQRFVELLDGCRQMSQSVQPTLTSIQQILKADLVCWYSTKSGRVISVSKEIDVDPGICAELATRILTDCAGKGDQLLWSDPVGAPKRISFDPRSAVMVRIGASQAWLMAVNGAGNRLFGADELGPLSVFQQLLLTYYTQAQSRVEELLLNLVHCLTTIIDARDPYTAGHSERVARIGMTLARRMGLTPSEVGDVYLGGLIHDIGKIGIQDSVLQKVGSLSRDETSHVREHPLIGDRIISSIRQFGRLRPAVRNHHERFDGTGYPDGLAGDQIPLLARILAVADACDAMMSPRRYRPALTPKAIDSILRESSGTQFDPQVIDAFQACRDEVYPPIFQRGADESAIYAIDQIIDALNDGCCDGAAPIRLADLDE